MRDPISVQTPSNHRKGSLHARLAAGMAAMLLLLAACSGTASPSPVPTVTSTPTAQPTPASTPTPTPTLTPTLAATPTQTSTPAPTPTPAPTASFPLTITDDEGTKVQIPAEPKHIISLSPANTEILFALGAGSNVVGGTDQDDYPAEAAALPDVATFAGVALDKVTALEPDLILAGGNGFTPPDAIKRLRDLHFPVVVVYAPTVAAVLADITLIGQVAGEPAAAEQIVIGMQMRMDAITAAVARTTGKPRTFYEIGYGPDIYGPAPGFFGTEMIELAGGDPITTGDPSVFSIPLEKLIEADPQVIVVGDALYGTCPADVAARDGWENMTAVRTGAIRPINDIVVTRPGPRLSQGLAALAQAIHPDVALDLNLLPTEPAPCTTPQPATTPTPGPTAYP